jgi:hypothetical protein
MKLDRQQTGLWPTFVAALPTVAIYAHANVYASQLVRMSATRRLTPVPYKLFVATLAVFATLSFGIINWYSQDTAIMQFAAVRHIPQSEWQLLLGCFMSYARTGQQRPPATTLASFGTNVWMTAPATALLPALGRSRVPVNCRPCLAASAVAATPTPHTTHHVHGLQVPCMCPSPPGGWSPASTSALQTTGMTSA